MNIDYSINVIIYIIENSLITSLDDATVQLFSTVFKGNV